MKSLGLSQPDKTVPLVWHADGVKIYKNQKIWVYSYSSMVRKKGDSFENKTVLAIIRDAALAKPQTHDTMAKIIAYICKTLQTGKYPLLDWTGNAWAPDSMEFKRAGQYFTADGWRCCFSAFKGDLEARVQIHKMIRNYMANMICEHCPAGKLLNYADFRKNAPWASVRFSHQEFLDLNPPNRQSAWVEVPGWRKERNLEDKGVFTFSFLASSKERKLKKGLLRICVVRRVASRCAPCTGFASHIASGSEPMCNSWVADRSFQLQTSWANFG